MNIHTNMILPEGATIYQCISIILAFILSSTQNETGLHALTFINGVREIPIISIYIWPSGQLAKGDNWIMTNLQPDSSVTLTLPTGRCNILAFDELDNSYGIVGFCMKTAPDTITVDLEYITFGRPNVDYGHHLLNLTNSLNGFALDTLILSSSLLAQDIMIDDFRLFPRAAIIIWLDKGIYSINAVDQIGRTFFTDSITIPDESCNVSIVSSMIENPLLPVGITGNGSRILFVENCLPSDAITELMILPGDGSDGIYLDSITLQPGEHIVANLNPGFYSVLATDDSGAEYYVSIEQKDTGSLRLPIVYEYLQYDFSFPEDTQE